MHHLVSAIRPGWFTKILIKRPAKNLDELRNWETKFMNIEELSDFDRNVQSENEGDKGKEKDKGPIYGATQLFCDLVRILCVGDSGCCGTEGVRRLCSLTLTRQRRINKCLCSGWATRRRQWCSGRNDSLSGSCCWARFFSKNSSDFFSC